MKCNNTAWALCLSSTQGEKWLKTKWTDFYRQAFIKSIRGISKEGTNPVPVIAAVTFASPMVGDETYASGFKGNSSQSPLGMSLPVKSAAPGMWLYDAAVAEKAGAATSGALEVVVRDVGVQLAKEVLFQGKKLVKRLESIGKVR